MMKPWKTLSRQVILDQAPWLIVEQHVVELPDGRTIPNWPWVITPDYVNVIAVTSDELFLVLQQTKYGLPGTTLAPVGGYIMPGEDPLEAAKRELLEETGYSSPEWRLLGSYLVDPNRGIARGYLYLAQHAVYTASPIEEDLEEQELLFLTQQEIENALDRNEILVLAWAAAFTFALQSIHKKDIS